MTIEICRTISTHNTVPDVFAFLSDFRSTNVWDPNTVRTELIEGDGGVGTRYRNVSKFAGRTVELVYVVRAVDPWSRIQLRTEKGSMTGTDTMTFAPTVAGGTEVTYRAVFEFSGPMAWVAPLLKPAFRRLGDTAEDGMQAALDGLNP